MPARNIFMQQYILWCSDFEGWAQYHLNPVLKEEILQVSLHFRWRKCFTIAYNTINQIDQTYYQFITINFKTDNYIMSNFQELIQIVDLIQTLRPDKICLGTSQGWHSKFWGTCQTLTKFRIFILDPSIHIQTKLTVNNDYLTSYISKSILQTGSMSCEQTAKIIFERLNLVYTQHNKLVSVWPAGQSCYTSWKGGAAWSLFLQRQNQHYGHDVLIILY